MTLLDEDESLAYEIIKALAWEDLTTPINGIPKVVALLQKHRKPTLHDQVLAFHKRFGQSIGKKPHVPDENTIRFRLSLIAEEFCELLDAANDPTMGCYIDEVREAIKKVLKYPAVVDLSDFVDAMADLDYVVEGTRITFGVDGTPIAAEVQRANMSKLPSYVAAKDAHHGKREPVSQRCIHCGNHRTVKFLEDGSTLTEENAMSCAYPRKRHEYPPLGEPVKREDGKILKPPGWTPPDIEGCLRAQGWKG